MPRVKTKLKIYHLDIETAPAECLSFSLWPKFISPSNVLSYGYTLCWAGMWEGERDVQFASIHEDGEEQMLRKIHGLLDEADAVVHYNGTKFDMPTLNREFVRYGMAPPSHYHQIDLLKTVRRQFRFESNKLDVVCQRLGLGAKTSHTGIQLWKDCMNGDAKGWKLMKKYNIQDIKLLRKLYRYLLPWILNHPNVGMWIEDPSKPVCCTCGSTNLTLKGEQHNTKVASYKRYSCNSCGTPLRARLQARKTSENVLMRSQ